MPRDLTTSEKLIESIRCDRAMIEYWRTRSTPEWHAGEVEKHRQAIRHHEEEIAKLDAQHAVAPSNVQNYERKVQRQTEELRLHENRGAVDKIKKLAEQAAALQAELAKAALTDPEAARALDALRGKLLG